MDRRAARRRPHLLLVVATALALVALVLGAGPASAGPVGPRAGDGAPDDAGAPTDDGPVPRPDDGAIPPAGVAAAPDVDDGIAPELDEVEDLGPTGAEGVGDVPGAEEALLAPAATGPQATLYEHGSFGGVAQGFAVGAYAADRGELGALPNDAVSSLRVPAGLQVLLCEHAGADAGTCAWYPAGDHAWVGAFNDRTSVVLVLAGGAGTGPGASAYAGRGLSGARLDVANPTLVTSAGLAPVGNDRISSLRVGLGRTAVLCEHDPSGAGATLGRCARYGTGDVDLPATWDDLFSTVAVARTQGGPKLLTHLDGTRLTDVTLAGSHNTFEKMGCNPASPGCDPADPATGFHYLWDAFDHVQAIELDVWTQDGRWYVNHHGWTENNNNCPKSGVYGATRNQDLRSCIDGLRTWHLAYPDHPFTIVKLEMKDGFRSGYSPSGLDDVVADVRHGGAGARLPRSWLFTPRDLMTCRQAACAGTPYATPDDAARGGNWPTMGQLRGKFMFVVTRGAYRAEGARQYANALVSGEAQLMFPSTLLEVARAGGDPRIGYYSAEAARWSVVFDLQYGRVDPEWNPLGANAPTIDPAVVAPLHGQGYLLFASLSRPTDRRWLVEWTPLGPVGSVERGSNVLRLIRDRYGFNVINTDQEKLGLRFPGLSP